MRTIQPWTQQVQVAAEALPILKTYGIVYLAMEERTGKSLTALLIAEQTTAKKVGIITKKKAFDDWAALVQAYPIEGVEVIVTTYHQYHKCDLDSVDLFILDESHNYLSAFPKPSAMQKKLRMRTYNSPIIFSSATPHAQGYQQLYHQFQMTKYSPWASYQNFYRWFKVYGTMYTITVQSREINMYDKCDEERILACCQHLFISYTRKELGFEQEPEDRLHYVELADVTKQVYNTLLDDNIIMLEAGELVCDTSSKLRFALHMLEGGVAKIGKADIVLRNTEKVEYIKKVFGDHAKLVIMYNYKAEKIKLESHFKKARLLQATSYAEGVDLHTYDDLVIYSQDFSTARHTQRRARQANMKRKDPIHVHYILVKKAISEQVYKTVSVNKKNFVDSVFKRTSL